MYLDAWCSAGGTVWEGLGGVALLDKVCTMGWALTAAVDKM